VEHAKSSKVRTSVPASFVYLVPPPTPNNRNTTPVVYLSQRNLHHPTQYSCPASITPHSHSIHPPHFLQHCTPPRLGPGLCTLMPKLFKAPMLRSCANFNPLQEYRQSHRVFSLPSLLDPAQVAPHAFDLVSGRRSKKPPREKQRTARDPIPSWSKGSGSRFDKIENQRPKAHRAPNLRWGGVQVAQGLTRMDEKPKKLNGNKGQHGVSTTDRGKPKHDNRPQAETQIKMQLHCTKPSEARK